MDGLKIDKVVQLLGQRSKDGRIKEIVQLLGEAEGPENRWIKEIPVVQLLGEGQEDGWIKERVNHYFYCRSLL